MTTPYLLVAVFALFLGSISFPVIHLIEWRVSKIVDKEERRIWVWVLGLLSIVFYILINFAPEKIAQLILDSSEPIAWSFWISLIIYFAAGLFTDWILFGWQSLLKALHK